MKFLLVLLSLLVLAHAESGLRVWHASPDAPAVDVYVDGEKAFEHLKYKESTHYAPVPPKTYNIQVTPSGATTPVVINANVTLDNFRAYTVAAAGKLASIAPIVFLDDQRFPGIGKTAVRFVHLSPNAPAVDVLLADTGAPLFKNVAFGKSTEYIAVKPGPYNLEVVPTGTTTVVLKVTVELETPFVHSVVAEGLVGSTGDEALTAVLTRDL